MASTRWLTDPDLQGKLLAQRLNVSAQSIKGVSIVASLLDAGHLGLRYAQPPGHFCLSEPCAMTGFHELEPELASGCFFLIQPSTLWIGQELVPPSLVASLSFGDVVTL